VTGAGRGSASARPTQAAASAHSGALLDGAIERLLGAMAAAVDAEVDVQERTRRLIGAYLDALGEEPTLARMFLVEVYAAGPDAVQRRVDSQQRVALW